MRRLVCALVINASLIAAPQKLVSIQAEPAQVGLDGKSASQQILVTGTYSDKSAHDVTAQAGFKSGAPKTAAVSNLGIVTPLSDGKAVLTISVKGAKKIHSCPR